MMTLAQNDWMNILVQKRDAVEFRGKASLTLWMRAIGVVIVLALLSAGAQANEGPRGGGEAASMGARTARSRRPDRAQRNALGPCTEVPASQGRPAIPRVCIPDQLRPDDTTNRIECNSLNPPTHATVYRPVTRCMTSDRQVGTCYYCAPVVR